MPMGCRPERRPLAARQLCRDLQPAGLPTVNGDYLDPAVGKSIEVDLKGEYLDGRFNTSVALFRPLKDNVATRNGNDCVAGSSDDTYVSAQGIRSRGIEAKVFGEPLTGWNLMAGITRTVTLEPNGTAFSAHLPRTLCKLGRRTGCPAPGVH